MVVVIVRDPNAIEQLRGLCDSAYVRYRICGSLLPVTTGLLAVGLLRPAWVGANGWYELACSTNATSSASTQVGHSASATVEPIILLLRVIDHFGAKIASPHLDDLGKVLVVLTCPAHLMLRRRCSCLLALRPCRA